MNTKISEIKDQAIDENKNQRLIIIDDAFRAARFATGLQIPGYEKAIAEPGAFFDDLSDMLLDDLILYEATLHATISQHFKGQAGLSNTELFKP